MGAPPEERKGLTRRSVLAAGLAAGAGAAGAAGYGVTELVTRTRPGTVAGPERRAHVPSGGHVGGVRAEHRLAVRPVHRRGRGCGPRREHPRRGDPAALRDRAVLAEVEARRLGERVGVPAAHRQPGTAGRPGAGRLRRGDGQRHRGAERHHDHQPQGRLPAVLGRADQPPDQRGQRAGGHRGRPVHAGAADVAHAPVSGLLPAGRHLPGRQPAGAAGRLPVRRVRPAGGRAVTAATGGGPVHDRQRVRGHRPGAAGGGADRARRPGRASRSRPASGPGDQDAAVGPGRDHGDRADRQWPGGRHAVVPGPAEAVPADDHADRSRRRDARDAPADRVPARRSSASTGSS